MNGRSKPFSTVGAIVPAGYRWKFLALGATLLSLSSGACGPGAQTAAPGEGMGSAGSEIVGGVTDNGHLAVVAIGIQTPAGYAICSGTLVSPTLVVTAAHCVFTTANPADYRVFFGTDALASTTGWVGVSRVAYHPGYIPNGYVDDVGVVVLAQASAVTPMPMRRTALPSTFVGQAITLVGFGVTSGTAQDEGTKRTATTTVTSLTPANQFEFGTASATTCQGDSGGAALWNVNGVETLVGITSYGWTNCTGSSWDMRVDAYTSFFDPFMTSACQANGVCVPGCNPPDPDCKQLGQTCATGPECESTQCSSARAGTVCTQACNAGACPSGFSCLPDSGGVQACFPAAFACVADGVCNQSCSPPDPDCKPAGAGCQTNQDCASNLCLAPPDASGRLCVIACNPAAPVTCSPTQSCKSDNLGHFYCGSATNELDNAVPQSSCLGCSSQGGASSPELTLALLLLGGLAARRGDRKERRSL